jgi:glycosyltransferase involved in cell wall biosynthesis
MQYIAEAIESVLISTYHNFELIIVDDCSVDSTLDIARKYERTDSRIRVYRNTKNLGDYPNRNKAASYAKGKYLKYLDSDDTMTPHCLERMVVEMEQHPECAFGFSSKCDVSILVHYPNRSFRTHFFERGILDNGPSATIIRKDVFDKVNGFLELRCVSDFEFCMRLALEYPLLEIEKNLIFWREHDQQEMKLGNVEYLKHSLIILKEKINRSSLNTVEQKKIIQQHKKATMRYLIKNIFKLGVIETLKYKAINQLKFSDLF